MTVHATRRAFGLALAVVLIATGLMLRAEPEQPVGSWRSMGAVADARTGAAAATLADGRTLITGGTAADGLPTDSVVTYDPLANSFSPAGHLIAARVGHTATLLADGRVLVVGGTTGGVISADIEMFDPSSGSSSLVALMAQPRTGHTAARLADGTVLIAGGSTIDGAVLQSAELFDPAAGTVAALGSNLQQPRTGASATTLIDGRVLVAGGSDGTTDLGTAEIFDPSSQSFTIVATQLSAARSGHTAVLLPHNASVLIAGGTAAGAAVTTADVFLPAQFPDPFSYGTGQFAATGPMTAARSGALGGPAGDKGYAFVAGGGPGDAEAYRFATIETDKDDYAPGERAIITGSGWQPGEDVTLLFQEDPAVHEDYLLHVTADGDGNIYWNQWAPEPHDIGVRFYLMASDSQSRAQTTFTDAELITAELTPVVNDVTVTQGGSANFTISLSATGAISAAITAASPSTAKVKTTYALNSGVLTSASFSADFSFFSSGTGCAGPNCDVTWTGAPTPYSVPASISADALTAVGTYTITLSEAAGTTSTTDPAVAGGHLDDTMATTINVHVVPPSNTAPELASIGSQSVDELVALTFTATATDSDVPANTLTFSLTTCSTGTFPAVATITTGGGFSWTPTEAQGPGTYCAKVVVTDNGTPNLSDSEEVSITVNEVNVAPELASIGSQSVDELVALTFTATATDSDVPANTLTFSLTTCSTGTFPAVATITTGGGFSWTPTEAQGPGTYCAKVVVTDNGTPNLSDSEEVSITVNEVNVAPVLTVPASFSTQWGVDPADISATATDADIPANTLTFSKVSGPGWVAVASNGTISFSIIPASAIGANIVTVKVVDNGTPPLDDEESFTITVTARPTQLTYDGKITGQYSDQSILSATLVDAGTGPAGGTPIAGESIAFTFNGGSAGSGTTNGSGKASVLYTLTQTAPGPYTVSASYSGANGYSSAGPSSANFTVSKESAMFDSVVSPGSIPVSLTSFQISANVRELRVAGVEPNPNDGALPGDIGKVAGIDAKITGIATNQIYNGVCVAGTVSGTGYGSIAPFTCTFSGGPFTVDAYMLTLGIPTANAYYEATSYEDALSVWDPNAGFATGGGIINLDGDRVSFGFSYTLQKGKTVPRSGFVAVRHLAVGGVCRVKSNNQMNAPAVSGNTATLSGKGNYTCSDALGNTTASQGNITIAAYAEDNGTSGINQDRFWVSNAAAVPTNYLQMPGPAGTNAQLLTGGNVQVPQPQKK